MKISRHIDSAGKSCDVSIDDNDQTVGLTISGTFQGILQIVGMVSLDGREIELTSYNPDGSIGNLEDPLPIDLFIDCGGYNLVKIIAVQVDSGSVIVSATTSSAARLKLTSDTGTGQEVQVTNFPAIFPVTGPLTNTQLRASPVPVTDAALLAKFTDVDTDGNPLPANFDNYPDQLTWHLAVSQTEVKSVNGKNYTTITNNDFLDTISKTIGGHTYTKTFSYDTSNPVAWILTGISGWVKT